MAFTFSCSFGSNDVIPKPDHRGS